MSDLITVRNERAYLNGQRAEELARDLYNVILSNGLIDGQIDGKPVEIKACQEWHRNGVGRCRGRFTLDREQHEFLVKNKGLYLFVVFTENGVKSKLVRAAEIQYRRKLGWPAIFGGVE